MWLVLAAYTSVEHLPGLGPLKSEEGVQSPGTLVVDGWKPPCRKSNLAPLEVQPMFRSTEEYGQLNT